MNLPRHFVTTVARSSETLLNFNLRKSSQVTADNEFNIDEIELQNTQTIFKMIHNLQPRFVVGFVL
jgi:hypothetical protein